MKLIDADALRARLDEMLRDEFGPPWEDDPVTSETHAILDATPSITCAADNPHGIVPSKCPTCGDPTDIDGRPCCACNVFMRQVTRERTDRTDVESHIFPLPSILDADELDDGYGDD